MELLLPLKYVAKRWLFNPAMYDAMKRVWSEVRIAGYHHRGRVVVWRRGLGAPDRLNFGSGSICKEGFLNVDLFPVADVSLDLRRKLPFESGCCELIFSEHFLEHLEYPESAARFVAECWRLLKPGGALKLSVPDTEWPLRDYGQGVGSGYFMACRENPWWHASYCQTRMEHINAHFRQNGEHLYAYDFETLAKLLKSVGFAHVGLREFEDGLDAERRRLGSLLVLAVK